MTDLMRGTDIPITLTNLPNDFELKRLDFSQNNTIIITKVADDFTYDGNSAHSTLTQEETLKLNDMLTVDIQLSYYANGLANRTPIKSVSADRILYNEVI